VKKAAEQIGELPHRVAKRARISKARKKEALEEDDNEGEEESKWSRHGNRSYESDASRQKLQTRDGKDTPIKAVHDSIVAWLIATTGKDRDDIIGKEMMPGS